MEVLGEMLIGAASVRGTAGEMRALDPTANAPLGPVFGGGGTAEVDRACRLADAAYASYSRTDPETRARFLEAIADGLSALGDGLVERVTLETGLTRSRVEGERARTATQLRMFADVVRRGLWRQATIDGADPGRPGSPRPDLRMQKVPLGPVAVFGSSNFPLLYSVAGGDTASALAAGCPVVVKAHPSHLGTSELVGRVIQSAVAAAGLHEGVFSLLVGQGNAIGEALVDHPLIQAVGFTGSEGGGMALVRRGQSRPQPIPVFAEMTSVNPTLVLPHALAVRGAEFARRFVDQMSLGVGQMCLKPGMVVAVEGEGYDRMRDAIAEALSAKEAAVMLNPGILANFSRGVEAHRRSGATTALGRPATPKGGLEVGAEAFELSARDLAADMTLADEMFGPAAVLVRCVDRGEMAALVGRLSGQLTFTIQMEPGDEPLALDLMPTIERKTARVIVNGFSNVVEISDATVHGGPYPATSDPRFTSVGATAIERFVRPICYQGLPEGLTPPALRDDNPLGLWRLRDGVPGRH